MPVANDVVIPVVFPDYLIAVPDKIGVPQPPVTIPGLPDYVNVPDSIYIPKIPYVNQDPRVIPVPDKVPYLGHAGVFFFNGLTGTTKYFEFGRYDDEVGQVYQRSMPDLALADGVPTYESLRTAMATVSKKGGHNTAILGCYIETDFSGAAYSSMLAFCETRMSQNKNPKREPYDILRNSCCHFMRETVVMAYKPMPWVFPPNPALYIYAVRRKYPTLDFKGGKLTVPVLGFESLQQAS